MTPTREDSITREAREYVAIAQASVTTPGAACRLCEGQAILWMRTARALHGKGVKHRRAVAYHVHRARINARAGRYLSCAS